MWKEIIAQRCTDCSFSEPATNAQIADAEENLKVIFPLELKELLMESDGVQDWTGMGIIWSVETIMKDNLFFRHADFSDTYMPLDALLFFADAGNGENFAFGIIKNEVRSSNIYVWNPIEDSRSWVAPSLQTYLDWWLTGKLSI